MSPRTPCSRTTTPGGPSSTRIAHWEGSSLLYSAITTTKNWRDHLSEPDARRVEELLSPELARFGYARATR